MGEKEKRLRTFKPAIPTKDTLLPFVMPERPFLRKLVVGTGLLSCAFGPVTTMLLCVYTVPWKHCTHSHPDSGHWLGSVGRLASRQCLCKESNVHLTILAKSCGEAKTAKYLRAAPSRRCLLRLGAAILDQKHEHNSFSRAVLQTHFSDSESWKGGD